jgi:hypothetical protein
LISCQQFAIAHDERRRAGFGGIGVHYIGMTAVPQICTSAVPTTDWVIRGKRGGLGAGDMQRHADVYLLPFINPLEIRRKYPKAKSPSRGWA